MVRAAQLASALEVSGYPKPGNVHRTANLKGMTFEHFISSSIAIGPALFGAAERGFMAGEGKIDPSKIGVGRAIKRAIGDTMKWQTNGNTNLGTVLLLAPLTAAAGVALGKDGKLTMERLRKYLSIVLKSTTPKDALDVYGTILMAKPGGLGHVAELDVRDQKSAERIKKEGISLYEIMGISSERDNVAKEWVTDMQITFEFGYPLAKKLHTKSRDMNTTTVQLFLELLSRYPDTFIQRTHGKIVADKVSKKATMIVRMGGMLTAQGRKLVTKFDEELRKKVVNPGTTADLTASSLMLSILSGMRP